MITDTHPEAARIQRELIRNLTPAQRFDRMQSLSATVIELSREAIARANPHCSQDELDVIFVRVHYGKELAERYEECLRDRRQ